MLNGGVTPSSAAEARPHSARKQRRPDAWSTISAMPGLYQFGAPLLKDLGLYTPGANENLENWSRTSKLAPGKMERNINIPGFPRR